MADNFTSEEIAVINRMSTEQLTTLASFVQQQQMLATPQRPPETLGTEAVDHLNLEASDDEGFEVLCEQSKSERRVEDRMEAEEKTAAIAKDLMSGVTVQPHPQQQELQTNLVEAAKTILAMAEQTDQNPVTVLQGLYEMVTGIEADLEARGSQQASGLLQQRQAVQAAAKKSHHKPREVTATLQQKLPEDVPTEVLAETVKSFGKHAGKRFDQLVGVDPGYVIWVMSHITRDNHSNGEPYTEMEFLAEYFDRMFKCMRLNAKSPYRLYKVDRGTGELTLLSEPKGKGKTTTATTTASPAASSNTPAVMPNMVLVRQLFSS